MVRMHDDATTFIESINGSGSKIIIIISPSIAHTIGQSKVSQSKQSALALHKTHMTFSMSTRSSDGQHKVNWNDVALYAKFLII